MEFKIGDIVFCRKQFSDQMFSVVSYRKSWLGSSLYRLNHIGSEVYSEHHERTLQLVDEVLGGGSAMESRTDPFVNFTPAHYVVD